MNTAYIAARAPYFGTETLLVQDHDVDDIIKALLRKHREEQRTYDAFSQQFWGGSARATARNIYNFLARKVTYDVEHPDDQTIKSPGAIIKDGYGDCKHYASFANGVLHSLQRMGYPIGDVVYRFAGYMPGRNEVHHVFSVIKNGGSEIWIDPVLPTFDNRKKYFAHIDKKVSMPLREINGVNYPYNDNVGNLWDDIKKGAQNTVTKVTKGAQNTAAAVSKGTQNTIDKAKAPVMKIGIAPARNSFLLLLKINAFNLAHRLYDFMHRNVSQQNELFKFWKEQLGGNPEVLKSNIEEGMRGYLSRHKTTAAEYAKKNQFLNGVVDRSYFVPACGSLYHIPGLSDSAVYKNASVGAEPATTAALLTAAAAIIAALAPILKRAGWSDSDKANADNVASAGAMAMSAAAQYQTGGTMPGANVVMPDGSSQTMLTTTVDTMADGTKVVTVKDTGNMDDQTGGGSLSETVKQAVDSIKSTIIEYKYPIAGGVGLLLLFKSGIFSPKKGRKR